MSDYKVTDESNNNGCATLLLIFVVICLSLQLAMNYGYESVYSWWTGKKRVWVERVFDKNTRQYIYIVDTEDFEKEDRKNRR